MAARKSKPKVAVWKFASCDGCQLSILDCENELLALAGAVRIANFTEASSAKMRGPYDLSIVEGSISTAHDAERIKRIRDASRILITIGACATAGGIQALRNFHDLEQFKSVVYARPDYISALATSTPIADLVKVDFELRGCPVNKAQLLEVITALVNQRTPRIPAYPVCVECKRRATVCIMVARGVPCLGPAVQAGCGAICPAYARGCYGCFGPSDSPNLESLMRAWSAAGVPRDEIVRVLRTFNAGSPPFRKISSAYEDHQD